MTERKEKAQEIWYPCLVLITVICLFLQGTPTSPIPLRQRGAAQIHLFLKEQPRVKAHGRAPGESTDTKSYDQKLMY